jgi:methionyl aminopeptidase
MTIAIEPMICQKDYAVHTLQDGWTVKTKDGGLAAHFEHTVAILKDRTEVLTRGWEDPDFTL